MKSIAEPNATEKDYAKYGLDKPDLTATVGAGSARATIVIGKADERGSSTRATCRVDDRHHRPALVNALRNGPIRSAQGRVRVPVVHGDEAGDHARHHHGGVREGRREGRRLHLEAAEPAKDVDGSAVDSLLSALSACR